MSSPPPRGLGAAFQRTKNKAVAGSSKVKAQIDQYRHSRTPLGRAESAFERGDRRFMIELSVDAWTMRTVQSIEDVGWMIDRFDYVQSESSTTTTHSDGSTETSRSSETRVVYIFNRDL